MAILPAAIGQPRRPRRRWIPRRGQVAALLGCAPDEIVFTSGGSEANNLALKGVCGLPRDRPAHIITSQIEHPATLEPCRYLARLGVAVTYVPVDGTGLVDPDDIRRAITRDTCLISVMHANNEVGTIQPIAEIAQIAREHGIRFHTDAAQSVGKIATRVDELGADMLSVAGHKVYAPKGIGALYIRRGVQIEPLIHGAGHEGGRRAGTESALLTAALGKACEVAQAWIGMPDVQRLRDLLWDRLRASFGNRVVLNGHRHTTPAEHAQRVVYRVRRRRYPRCHARRGCFDRVGLSCRSGRAVAGAAGDECRTGSWHGGDPLQSWPAHH